MSRSLPASILFSALFVLPMAGCYEPGPDQPTDDPARGGKGFVGGLANAVRSQGHRHRMGNRSGGDGPGRSANLLYDGTGRLHLVYRLSGNVLYQSQDLAGAWSEPQVLDQDVRMASDRIAMAIAPNGQLHLVYSDGKSRELRHLVSE